MKCKEVKFQNPYFEKMKLPICKDFCNFRTEESCRFFGSLNRAVFFFCNELPWVVNFSKQGMKLDLCLPVGPNIEFWSTSICLDFRVHFNIIWIEFQLSEILSFLHNNTSMDYLLNDAAPSKLSALYKLFRYLVQYCKFIK